MRFGSLIDNMQRCTGVRWEVSEQNGIKHLTCTSVGTRSDLSSQTAISIMLRGPGEEPEGGWSPPPYDGKHGERCLGWASQADSDVLTSRNQAILPSDETERGAAGRPRQTTAAGEIIQHSAGISVHLP